LRNKIYQLIQSGVHFYLLFDNYKCQNVFKLFSNVFIVVKPDLRDKKIKYNIYSNI
jgi:hypothetical protein